MVFALLTLPPGAPLRNPDTGDLIGNSPFMNGLIALIMLLFLATGAAYGIGAGTLKNLTDVIKAIEKALSGSGRHDLPVLRSQPVRRLLHLHQHGHRHGAEAWPMFSGTANIGALRLLIGFIIVVAIIDLLITGAIAKWAIFAPVFVPLLMKLGVDPEAVLAAYRVGDSPMNAITPLNAYFALVVGFAQKYDKNAGVGTVVVADAALRRLDFRALDGALRRLVSPGPALGAVSREQGLNDRGSNSEREHQHEHRHIVRRRRRPPKTI